MFKRFVPLMLVSLLLAMFLVACGDDATSDNVPSYSGATSITMNASSKSAFEGSLTGQVKSAKVDYLKTSDDMNKVKSFYTDSMKKNGWTDKANELGDTSKQMEAVGAFVLGWEKGSKAAVVMGLPGSISGAMGFDGVGANDTVLLVITGSK